MMALLSGALTWLVGKGASSFTLPALILGSLILGHQFIQQREAKITAQATNICDESWKTATRQQERDAARAESVAVQEILQGERQINAKLSKDLETINAQFEDFRTRAGNDPRCLSDGVLRSLEGLGPDLGPDGGKASGLRSRKK